MNPFGIIDALIAAAEVFGHALGRAPKKESHRERVKFLLLYLTFLIAGIAAIILAIRTLYF